MNPLPNVIGQIASSVSSVIQSVQPQVADESKPVLFLYAKNLLPEKLSLLRQYGKVLVWQPFMLNHPLSSLDPCDYLVMDFRQQEVRQQLAKEDLTKWNVVHYVSWISKVEDYLEQIQGNVLSSLPKTAVNKADFDNQLLNQPLVEPSMIVSCLKRLAPCFI
jgi:hypothetical protein